MLQLLIHGTVMTLRQVQFMRENRDAVFPNILFSLAARPSRLGR